MSTEKKSVKRSPSDTESIQNGCTKRQKVSHLQLLPVSDAEVTSGKQLQSLLSFVRDYRQSTTNIQSFKSFLDGILASKDPSTQLQILHDYFKLQNPNIGDEENLTYIPDLFQTWKFASDSNIENLLSAVPAVLALLLRVLSSSLELSSHGLSLGRLLLQKNQLELIERGLSANKNKEYLISPVLRLLREISMFDGGALSSNILKARNYAFRSLIRNLNLRYTGKGVETLRKPSVRTNAVRFVLQLLKYLSIEHKKELLNQRDIFSALIYNVLDDPPFLVLDILEILKTHVLNDKISLNEAKSKLLTSSFLWRIASLYRYDKKQEDNESSTISIPDSAHELLLIMCTSMKYGALISQFGFYPREALANQINDNIVDLNSRQIDLGLDSIEWIHKFTEKVTVRNIVLSEFIHKLKPWSSIRETELIISIFKVAPELVAEYYFVKNNFLIDSKLSASWVGYSNFIHSTVRLPIPDYFGHNDKYALLPPPFSIVMENLLPRQLTRKLFIKCLNQTENKLIAFFVVRILCTAFEKLQVTLRMCKEASNESSSFLWSQYSSQIVEKFAGRCPPITHISAAYKRLNTTDICQREVFTKLLVLYYETLPNTVMETGSGALNTIGETILAAEKMDLTSQDGILRAFELENIFKLASFSPGVKWFNRGNNLQMSPFLAMLRLSALTTVISFSRLRSVLTTVIQETQLIQTESELDYLSLSLRGIMKNHGMQNIYDYIDSCILRCIATPNKYIFRLEEIYSMSNIESPRYLPSLLLLAMLDQWPYHTKSIEASSLNVLASFISRYLASSVKLMKNESVIKLISEDFAAACPHSSEAQKIIQSYMDVEDVTITQDFETNSSPINPDHSTGPTIVADCRSINFPGSHDMKSFLEDNSALVRWRNRDIEEVIEGGHLGNLVMLLSSEHLSIRREALTNITKLAQNLKDSLFEEKDQIWLLLMELGESAKGQIIKAPLPVVISSFCYHSISVLKDPSHFLFPKVNKFLSQRPIWQLDKIPLMHSLTNEPPSIDGTSYSEREWLINLMYDGIYLKSDLEIFRKRSVFERLLSFYNVYFGEGLQERILKVIARASLIEGGSTTLVTRFSLVTWLEIHQALSPNMIMHELHKNILRSCNQKRVRIWSKRAIVFTGREE